MALNPCFRRGDGLKYEAILDRLLHSWSDQTNGTVVQPHNGRVQHDCGKISVASNAIRGCGTSITTPRSASTSRSCPGWSTHSRCRPRPTATNCRANAASAGRDSSSRRRAGKAREAAWRPRTFGLVMNLIRIGVRVFRRADLDTYDLSCARCRGRAEV